ncbi:MAG: Ig-like domain-containing protein [Bacilli bacterium]|nr:Ig-like domain-containing protein [Bacilli bacterium]MDD4795791.1 Ig-like domain-containing protein [Bacilli bacterium]
MDQPFTFENVINEDIIIVPNYIPIDESKIVVVDFDTDGGTNVNSIEALIDTAITKPIDPIKKGYDFQGWYLNGNAYDFTNLIVQNITLKAKWNKSTSNSSNNNPNDSSKQITETSPNYKCVAFYSAIVKESTGVVGQNYHISNLFDTSISYSSGLCYITYKSSDNSIASISNEGFINANKSGTAYVYACINDNDKKAEVGCFKGKLTITAAQQGSEKNDGKLTHEEEIVSAKKFANDVNGYFWYLDTNSYAYLHPTIMEWYDHTLLNWASNYMALSGNKFVTSDSTGVLYTNDSNIHNTFLANPTELGYYIISQYKMRVSNSKLYITIGGQTYSFTRSSSKKSENVSLKMTSDTLNIDKGLSKDITVNISPYFFNHNITTTSSNSSVATCYGYSTTSNGNITLNCTGYKSGTATITVKDTIGSASTSFNVIVNNSLIKADGVTLNNSTLNLQRGNSSTLVASVSPNNADNKTVNWSTSNASVATVSNGKVTAVGAGTAIITVTTQDGNYTANCTVTITNPPLTATAAAGIANTCTNNGCGIYTYIYITPTGGDGVYTYSYTVYKDGSLIGSYTQKETYLTYSKGSYRIDYTVTDGSGKITSGTSTTTIS